MAAVIRGRVTDPGGQGVPGARVYFRGGPEDLPDIAALTSATGEFALTAPSPGRYVVESTADGFEQRAVTVDVTEDSDAAIEISLGDTDRPAG